MRISDWSSDVCSSDLKVPFSAEQDFRLDEMKVRYLRCDGTSVRKDVEDWGEEIRLRCLEREITFVTLHGPIQAFGKLAEDLLSIGDGLGPTGFRQTLQRRFAAVEGRNEICGIGRAPV